MVPRWIQKYPKVTSKKIYIYNCLLSFRADSASFLCTRAIPLGSVVDPLIWSYIQGCIFAQNRIFLPKIGYFCPTPFPPFQKDIFSPKYSENFPFFPRFSSCSLLYLRFFLVNHHIFSPANHFFIFLPTPPP